MSYGHDSPVALKVVELCLVHSVKVEMCMWPQVSGAPRIHTGPMIRNPTLRYSQNSTQAIYPEIGQPRNF